MNKSPPKISHSLLCVKLGIGSESRSGSASIGIRMESSIRIGINPMQILNIDHTYYTVHTMLQVGRGVSVPGETSGAQTSSRGQILH